MSPFLVKATDNNGIDAEQAREAVRTLLRYMCENPDRD